MRPQDDRAFTLVELLVVLALLALGAALLLPALAHTRPGARGLQCLNNHRQLLAAWTMYAGDYQDSLPINDDSSRAYAGACSWVGNIMDWTFNPQNFNPAYLTDSRVAALGPYAARNSSIYRCPADTYLSAVQQSGGRYRCRSVGMNAAVGDGSKQAAGSLGWSGFFWAKRMSDFKVPGPSESWVLMDENPDSIDDGIVYVNPACATGLGTFTELPSGEHGGAGGLAFADGRAELHRWSDSRTLRRVSYTSYQRISVSGSPDLAYLAAKTPRAQ